MTKYFNKPFYLFAVSVLVVFSFYGIIQDVEADGAATSVVITVCGNDIVEAGEDCDGVELDGETCASQGYSSGTLACASNCSFDTSSCVTVIPDTTPPPSVGGGGSYIPPAPAETKVILQGKSHSNSNVTVLKDGQVVTNTGSDSGANFKIEISNITAGTYTFGIWAEDIKGLRSITFNFTVNVQENTITTISGIFIPPTITINKNNFNLDDIVNIYGSTAPLSRVEVYVSSENPMIYIVDADNSGKWGHEIAAADLGKGDHIAKAKASDPDGLLSTYSKILAFSVGEGAPAGLCAGADFNCDGRVDLIDFSIMLYWWGKDNETADLNGDRKVDLIDFSIMMYWWTG